MKNLLSLRELSLRAKRSNQGQAAIEFIAIVVVIFFFLLFFLSLSILIVTSEYLDYATFMTARTYKSGLPSRQLQEERARAVFSSYAGKVDTIARNFRTQFSDDGVAVQYDINMFYLPPVFITGDLPQPVSQVTLTTDAHLGRDPSFEDCRNFFLQLLNKFGATDPNYVNFVDDTTC